MDQEEVEAQSEVDLVVKHGEQKIRRAKGPVHLLALSVTLFPPPPISPMLKVIFTSAPGPVSACHFRILVEPRLIEEDLVLALLTPSFSWDCLEMGEAGKQTTTNIC